ncbi:AraC family transcriptional regulator [bacterium]|nr:MAG: AraC family transcriptional regulator [bacterium]
METSLAWDVPLDKPPEIVNIGRNAHGYVASDRYRLKDLWSLHLYGYHGRLRLDGREFAIEPGMVGITPPGTLMEYRYVGLSVHLYAHFHLGAGPSQRVEALQRLGPRHDSIYARFYEGVGRFATEPRRVEARLWDLLWEVALLSRPDLPPEDELHPAVRLAMTTIERHLAEPLSVAEIAARANVSPSYLSRLFREAFGETVVATIRHRRLERAAYLLGRSSLPIKEIAIAVGLPDLQHFNKAMRTRYGASPREWRARESSSSPGSEIDHR